MARPSWTGTEITPKNAHNKIKFVDLPSLASSWDVYEAIYCCYNDGTQYNIWGVLE
jgi:hypothetical protein